MVTNLSVNIRTRRKFTNFEEAIVSFKRDKTMNKNLVDYCSVWAEVEPEAFDNIEDAVDWTLYQLTELQRLIRHHIFHQCRPHAFVVYVDRTRNLIMNEILRYMQTLNSAEKQQVHDKVSPVAKNMVKDAVELRKVK